MVARLRVVVMVEFEEEEELPPAAVPFMVELLPLPPRMPVAEAGTR